MKDPNAAAANGGQAAGRAEELVDGTFGNHASVCLRGRATPGQALISTPASSPTPTDLRRALDWYLFRKDRGL